MLAMFSADGASSQVHSDADAQQRQLQRQLMSAYEDKATHISGLEDTIRRLSARSDLNREVSRLSADNNNLRRTEARLKSELALAEEQVRQANAI